MGVKIDGNIVAVIFLLTGLAAWFSVQLPLPPGPGAAVFGLSGMAILIALVSHTHES